MRSPLPSLNSLPLLLLLLLSGAVASAQVLPAEIEAALLRAKLPRDAVTLLVVDAQPNGKEPPRLSHRAAQPVNPASVMKLVTTYAALDILGPAFSWKTPVYTEGAVQGGVLTGNLYIKGQGDPKLVSERLWLLLKRVQGLGIKSISGDIVLDRSAFEMAETNPADFDGEPLRPYNAAPDALLINFKSMVMNFTPDRAANVASIAYDLPLAGVQMQTSVPLSAGRCDDWRATLKADYSDPLQVRFLGNYPASCGERVWPIAYAEPKAHAARAVEGLWREMGGKLGGKVREGRVPPALKPVLEAQSAALAETIRDINKFSNNVMAQQVFLTLSLQAKSTITSTATFAASREVLRTWWNERFGESDAPTLDNGSGLSRSERISAQALARMLQHAWASPVMPELMSSLPIAGVDGTLRNRKTGAAQGSAHLKTGSLSNVAAVAGYVHGMSGKRYVLIAIANHPNAGAAREAFDALLHWTAKDQ